MSDRQRTARLRRADVPRAGRPRHRAARPRRLQRAVRHELVPRGRGRRGQVVVRGRRQRRREGRRRASSIYPPTRGAADPGRSVRAGEDRRSSSTWISASCSPTGSTRRSSPSRTRSTKACGAAARSQLVIADARGLPRENYRKVHRRLPVARRAGLRRRARSDDLRQLARAAGHRQRARRRRASAGPARTGSPREYCFTVANGDIPTEGVMCAQLAAASRGSKKVGLFWEQGSSGTRLRRLLPRHRDAARPRRSSREVKLEPNPRGLKDDLADDARPRRRGRLLRRLRLRDVPLRRGVQGARLGPAPGHGHRVHVLFELATSGPRASRAGTASTSSARTAPTPTTTR